MNKTLVLLTLGLLAAAGTLHAADAKETYEKQCAKCHGKDGKGSTPTGKKLHVKDYTDAKVQASMTDADMTKIIKEGKKEGDATKMKAYSELSDADVKALVAYIRAFKS